MLGMYDRGRPWGRRASASSSPRATLARLFEAEGALTHYVQKRRSHRAFVMLDSAAYRHWRIIDIALECNFSSDATFTRAFR